MKSVTRKEVSGNKRANENLVQREHVGRGDYNRLETSTRVQPAPSIPTLSAMQDASQSQAHFKSIPRNPLMHLKQVREKERRSVIAHVTHDLDNHSVPLMAPTHVEENDNNVLKSPIPDAENNTGFQKKSRGVTRCLDILNVDKRQVLVVGANEFGQPVGPNARKLSSYIGIIARNPQKAPLTCDDWRKVPQQHKNHMWDLVKEKFEVDDALYPWVMKSLGSKWKNFKCKLRKQYKDDIIDGVDIPTIVDTHVDPVQWKDLIQYWRSEKGQQRSDTNKLNREKQIVGHTAGSKSFAVIREEIRQKRSDEKNPSRAELFSITHTRKDGRPVNEESARVMAMLQERSSQEEENTNPTTLKDDILSQVLGEDKSGRIRMLGLGPTPSSVYGPVPTRSQALQMVNQIKTSSEAIMSKMFDKVEEMKMQHEKMKESYEDRLGNLHAEIASLKEMMHKNNKSYQAPEESSPPSFYSSASSHEVQTCPSQVNIPIPNSHTNLLQKKTKPHVEAPRNLKRKGRNDDYCNAQGRNMVCLKSFKKTLLNVALGTIESRDPLKKVGGCELGHEYWEVAIKVALVRDELLPRPYGRVKTIGDAIGTTIAWPFTLVNMVDE